ncbi:PREDICTED: ATP synthase subunit gamma, mitochondrial [Wasmannia auropunctata]|uniref:ATP synthase subunit gamma, mitochondrial n=1 Tax=Wasmannia auropunctata TaxID=64793 RepID=UPI0005EDBCCA|nr:PREDICTED: ATP synthase subunit gamma, mitochondrial [Wasmannia auropunctata]XP_011697107.1 PREDICTED: ATP synthase subunit gamma, mitochondrial [Wasmannia auropunctata]XP_011697108.1 PREDICTED: ATP synthase subunit gamma, mitochondrial [Wasmannia auropunctata]
MLSNRVSAFLRLAAQEQQWQQQQQRGMATLKSISIRLKSVKNIQKITQSMKMVSAAKYNRAERDLKQARPLGEGTKVFYEQADIQPPPEPKKLVIAVTSDRGLCGAVHTGVSRNIRDRLLADPKERENTKIICIGEKSRAILQRLFANNILFVASEVGRKPPTFNDAAKIANQILNSGYPFGSGRIVYNRFKSVVSYAIEDLPLYDKNAVIAAPKLSVYDAIDDEVIQSYLEFSLASLLFYTMKESACSEQSSRMTAMDNASKNAGEMIDKLTLTFNRTRQAVITRELIEIISGAAALE